MTAHTASMMVLWLSIGAGTEAGTLKPAPSSSPAAKTSEVSGGPSRHELVVHQPILAAEEGLLLGNGDLSLCPTSVARIA
jgi:hypothetical protein